MAIEREISEFYEGGKEAGRLSQGLGRIEFVRMQELMRRYLLPAPAVIADVGGGPGAYACWLAGQGYKVHLIDPVPLHVEQARVAAAKQPPFPLASAKVGDARGLELADSSVDAVLLFGPLYHLTEKYDRMLALAEAWRVLRDGGVLLAVGISPYSSALVGVVRGWVFNPAYMGMIRQEMASGQHRCPEGWKLFTSSFFHHPDLLKTEVYEAGYEFEAMLGVEGPGWMAPDLDAAWGDESRRAAILELARLMELEPVHSPHVLVVARKTGNLVNPG